MKHVFLILSVILLLASCSQKQFTFRKKINVSKAEVVALKPIQNDVVTASNPGALNNDKLIETYHQPLPFIEQGNALSTPSIYVLPEDTIRKKYKFGVEKPSNDSDKNNQSNNSYTPQKDKRDKNAMIGFWLGIGAFFFSPLAIPGLVFSIMGLKSKNRKGFAIAGLIISGLIVLMFILLIIVFIMLINALGNP